MLAKHARLLKPCGSSSRCTPFLPALRRPSRSLARPVRASAEPQASGQPPAVQQAPPAASSVAAQPPVEYYVDTTFNLSKISFGTILTPLGIGLLSYGFGAYFMLLPGADIAALMLIYGFPISVLGFALSYAQLDPVPLKSDPKALLISEAQMTTIQQQVRDDTTRFRYGDDQHLDEALVKIFKLGRSGGLGRKEAPRLVGLREEVMDGMYTLVLEFQSKKDVLDQARWNDFQPKFQSFFGPGIVARIEVQKGKANMADVMLICDGTGTGRGTDERKDPLMPIYPGIAPRKQ